jgi:hypothetical protein
MYRQLRITDSTRTALLGHNEIDEDYYHENGRVSAYGPNNHGQ